MSQARAQFTFASDDASQSAYSDGWQSSDNGGYGFGGWSLASGGGSGGFGGNIIGDPNAAGISTFGTNTFAQFANPTGSGAFANADRTLASAMQVGDTFSFQWAINWDSGGGGNKGFNLYTGGVGGTQLINVNNGDSSAITINGTNTGFGFGLTVMTWTFSLTAADTLVVTANDRDGSGTYSNSFTIAGSVDAFRFYASSMQAGDQAQPYFNNFAVTNSGLYNVAAAQTESRFLTGSGNLAKTGNGTLTISGTTNNFTGTVGITNGAVRVTAGSALGSSSGVTVQSGAALEYSGGITVNRNTTINGTGISTGGALRNISGNNTHSGNLTLGSASRIASDAGTLTISGAVSGSNIGLTVGGAGNTVMQTAIGIGTGRLTKENAGTLTLTANNTFTGNTLISGGALRLGNGGTAGAVTGTITNNGTLIYHRSDNIAQSGVISGTGAVIKQGAGKLTLSNANTYSGTTTVSDGTLLATTSTSLGTTAGGTTVEDGATLEISSGATIAENITITGSGVEGGGAIRSLGDGKNTLSGTITLGGNARINVDAPIGSVTELVSLGTDDYTVEGGATTMAYSQTSTALVLNGAFGLGDTIGGYLPESNWGSVANFGLLMSVTSASNAFAFTVEFYDGNFNVANTYSGTTFGVSNSPTVAFLSLTQLGSGIMTNISGLQFTWDTGGNINSSLASIVSIPTSGLLISGNISGGNNVLTLGSAEAGAGTVSEGLQITGVISGAGGSYSGTTTSLVKDGAGTVTLTGNNTFTGDIRVEQGILAVAPGGSTNALGVGADLFLSSLGGLAVRGNVAVSSIQGAGVGDNGTVQLSDGYTLTINGAGKTMTMAGTIAGAGVLRVDGSSATQLTLTGDNTFANGNANAVNIAAGTLVLAGTEGNQALRLAGRIAIGASGKLLLQTSDQVNDFGQITLSGGTIQRGSGVSEVFGGLTVSSASFLDFGTGAAGNLSFGTYTPSALLTIQNFDFGSTLTFKSNLTGSINNTSFFTFENGGISSFSWDSGTSTFTITAIPEPSTYAAAAGLIALMLWPARRRLLKDVKSVLGLRAPMRDRLARSRQ